MAIGRISGPLLKANLLRDGVNLAFETDLLFLDVVNGRIGINTANPTHDLTVNGTTRTTNLEVTTEADIASFNIVDNTISSSDGTIRIEPSGSNPVVYQGKLVTGSVQLSTNTIETLGTDTDLNIQTTGTGNVNINTNVEVYGDLHATGNISADGDIVIGDTNSITFNADVASNIIPDVTNTYDLGSDPTVDYGDEFGKEWRNAYIKNIFATTINANNISGSDIDLLLEPGNTYYVGTTGNDTNTGSHPNDPFLTIKHALTQVSIGDIVYIYSGTYQEQFPLTIPAGVTVKGSSIRAVKIIPTAETNNKDAFLINGETTVEDLTVSNFFFDSINNTGYAFKFAEGLTVSSRSPYIRNVTVITKGSTTTANDPHGFDSDDAGKGAYIDGSAADVASKEASMLFHSVTFITPNQEAIVATNGVRIELLNTFSYFADKGIDAYSSSVGFAGAGKTRLQINNQIGNWNVGDTLSYYDTDGTTVLASGIIHSVDGSYVNLTGRQLGFVTTAIQDLRTTSGGTAQLINFVDYSDFGAEIRSIGSANVYGNYGTYGDGPGVVIYLISQNYAYVGSGKLSNNNPTDGIQANEVVELNGAEIYYTSFDQEGNFQVGDIFRVNQQSGDVLFGGQSVNVTAPLGIIVTDGIDTTVVKATGIDTGNLRISGNTIESLTGSVNITAANDTINLQNNTVITGNLDVTGNVTISGNTTIGDETTDTINFVAGIGSNLIPDVTETYDLGTQDLRWNNAYLSRAEINGVVIDNNTISVVIQDTDLTLSASGTGRVTVPTSDVQIDQSLTVGQNLTVTTGVTSLQDVEITGTITQIGNFDQTGNFTTSGDVEVTGNITGTGILVLPQITLNGNSISGTQPDADLQLTAVGTGQIYIPSNNVQIDNNLVVGGTLDITGTSTLASVGITGTLTQTGNFNQTGNATISGTIQSGSITSSGTLTLPEIIISDSEISGTVVDKDVEIIANGTGEVLIPDNNVRINNNLSVGGTMEVVGASTLASVGITGILTQTGDFDQTGNFTTSGTVEVTGNTTLGSSITIPNITISGSSISTNANNLNLVLSAHGTGQVIVQDLGINGATIAGQTPGDITISPQGGGVVINSVKSLVIPAGETSDRPSVGTDGMIRYNTSLDRYEGFANGNWIALAGIQNLTGTTRITPELTPGAGDNTIRFYANDTLVSTIDSTKLYTISLETNDLNISNDTISAVNADTDIKFTTSGTGGVVVGDLKFRNGEITNTVSGGITQFNTTGTGYVKIAGTFGTVIPRGTVASRPLAANSEIGMMRYNIDLQFVEIWNGTIWENVAASSGGINLVDATSLSIVNAIVFG